MDDDHSTSLRALPGYMNDDGRTDDDGWEVDKDVAVAKEHFKLLADYNTMSPLVIHKEYTRQYLDGKVSPLDTLRWGGIHYAW